MRIGWVPDGETVVIAGREIPGMVFVCDSGQKSSIGIENSSSPIWIDVSKPVGNRYRKGAPLGGKSYNTMIPESRGCYLDWLASGKSDIQVHPDILMLHFHALEHRLLQGDASVDEKLGLMDELKRLNTIFSSVGKFRKVCNHFVRLLDFCKIAYDLSDWEIRNIDEFLKMPLDLNIDFSNSIKGGEALTGEQLFQWLDYDYMGFDSGSLKPSDLKEEFLARFEQTYPNGIAVEPFDRNLTVNYVAVSGEFTVSKVVTDNHRPVLDVYSLSEPLDVALAIFDVLKRYPRGSYIGQNFETSQENSNAENGDSEIVNKGNANVQVSPKFSEWAEDLVQNRTPTTFDKLMRALGKRRPKFPSFQLWEEVVDDVSQIGYGIAPNSIFQMHYVAWDDPIFLYKSDVSHLWGSNPHFYAALAKMGIGVFVYSEAEASAEYLKERLQAIVYKYETDGNFHESDIAGLHANAEYLAQFPPSDELIRELKVASKPDFLEEMRLAVIEFAGDPEVPRFRGVSIAQSVYRIFGLDPNQAEADMQSP